MVSLCLRLIWSVLLNLMLPQVIDELIFFVHLFNSIHLFLVMNSSTIVSDSIFFPSKILASFKLDVFN